MNEQTKPDEESLALQKKKSELRSADGGEPLDQLAMTTLAAHYKTFNFW